MNYCLRALLIFTIASFSSVSCMQAADLDIKEPNLAPDFKLRDLEQNIFTLSDYKDRHPVLLFFWTTWCPFCRKELKLLKQMYPELVNNGLQVLAINVGEPAYKVANFVTSYQLNYKVLLDKDTNVTYSFDVLGVPTYVLVGEKGKITFISHTFPKDKYKDLIQR